MKDPASDPAPAIFNRQAFMAQCDNNKDLVRAVIAVSLDSMPTYINTIKGHIEQGAALAAGSMAHKLKGSAGMVSGAALAAVAYETEKAGKSGDLERVKTLLPELDRQFGLLKEMMVRELGE